MTMLKAMAAWPDEPRLKQIVKDAKLAMFELDSASHTSIQRAKISNGVSGAGDSGSSGSDRKKHIMISYSR